jgi:hypothetical protein
MTPWLRGRVVHHFKAESAIRWRNWQTREAAQVQLSMPIVSKKTVTIVISIMFKGRDFAQDMMWEA